MARKKNRDLIAFRISNSFCYQFVKVSNTVSALETFLHHTIFFVVQNFKNPSFVEDSILSTLLNVFDSRQCKAEA